MSGFPSQASPRKSLPVAGRSWPELEAELQSLRGDDADWRRGRTPLHVYHADEQTLDVARRAYAMFIAENALAPAAFPSLARMQRDLIDIALSLLGGGPASGGTLTSGGTESIVLATRSAWRTFRMQERHLRPGAQPHLLLPSSAHPAWDKAAELMGLETIRIALDADWRADVAAFAAHLREDTVLAVASAPSLPFGAVDPVETMAECAAARGVWLHVDACIGGFLAPHVAALRPGVPAFDLSIPGVRSLSADLHKFGYTPKGASVVLYRDDADRRHGFAHGAWPKGMYRTDTLGGTRPGGAIAAAWAVMHHLGVEGYRALAERAMSARDRLLDGIAATPGLRVLGTPPLSVIAFGAAPGTDDSPAGMPGGAPGDSLDIHAVGDALAARGWYVSRLSEPAALHMTVTANHLQAVEPWLRDLAAGVAEARERTRPAHERLIETY